jgi:diguanylate cyclase (GGDEF)-like protein/PAS domain S-box-containing protein
MQWVDTAPTGLREASVVDLRSDDAVVVLDRSGRCVGTDDAAHPILGVASERLLGRPRLESAWRWCDTDGRPLPEDGGPVARVLATGEPVRGLVLGLEGVRDEIDGQFAWVEVTAYPLRGPDGTVDGVATSLHDVSQTPQGRAATAALVHSLRSLTHASFEDQARFRVLAENSADVLFQTDVVGRCVWVSPSVADVLGWTPEQVLGQSLFPLLHPSDREVANEQRRSALSDQGGGHDRVELRYATAGGGWRWTSTLSRPLRDAHGNVIGGLTALRDIQEEVERRDELSYLAGHDSLTGLVNRDTALHALAKALDQARRTDRWVGVLYVDVDHFKEVNDTFGHAAGDRLLVEVGRRFTAMLRDSDVVARLGGDEFLVVLTSMRDGEHALARAEALRTVLAEPDGDGVPSATVSIGVRYDDGTSDPGQVLRDADAALYRAKNSGRDRVSV